MEPIIAIVGRPNVGKSTLFNRLTQSRQALVADHPGLTRDRQFGNGYFDDKPYIVIDTPGIVESPEDMIEAGAVKQTLQAMKEADAVFFVVDARAGLTPQDREFANALRKMEKKLFLLVNKTDGLDPQLAMAEFYQLGFEHCYPIAASHNHGIQGILEMALNNITPDPQSSEVGSAYSAKIPKVAIIGKPNVGKSTLINRMLGFDRNIVSDVAGTTRDSIYVPMERFEKPYILIDTAGVRRKKNVSDMIEKFSIVKTLQAIKDAHVAMILFDAQEGLTDQDLTIIDFALDAGRGLIICANKWDGMQSELRAQVKEQLQYRLKFVEFAPVHFISALHGTGVGDLFKEIDTVYESVMMPLSTTKLTGILKEAIEAHPPPLVQGRRIKMRYAHCGGHNPPLIIIHGNQTKDVPQTYERYLSKFFMEALGLEGAWVKIIFKSGENPYAGKRNVLSARQVKKRQRLMKHVKKSKKKS